LSPITVKTSAPKWPTGFFASNGPRPLTQPPPRYHSTPSQLIRGVGFKTWP
jgi:hypothetical protein